MNNRSKAFLISVAVLIFGGMVLAALYRPTKIQPEKEAHQDYSPQTVVQMFVNTLAEHKDLEAIAYLSKQLQNQVNSYESVYTGLEYILGTTQPVTGIVEIRETTFNSTKAKVIAILSIGNATSHRNFRLIKENTDWKIDTIEKTSDKLSYANARITLDYPDTWKLQQAQGLDNAAMISSPTDETLVLVVVSTDNMPQELMATIKCQTSSLECATLQKSNISFSKTINKSTEETILGYYGEHDVFKYLIMSVSKKEQELELVEAIFASLAIN